MCFEFFSQDSTFYSPTWNNFFLLYFVTIFSLYFVAIFSLYFITIYSLLYVAGFAINFFLYTVSGSVFRDQLLRIFSRWRQLLVRGACMSCTRHCGRKQAIGDHDGLMLTINTLAPEASKMTASPFLTSSHTR